MIRLNASESYLATLNKSFKSNGEEAGLYDADAGDNEPLGIWNAPLVRKLSRLLRKRPVILCGESGMGVPALLTTLTSYEMGLGTKVRVDDLAGIVPDDAMRVMDDEVLWCRSSGAQSGMLVVCENVPCGDEVEIEQMVGLMRKVIASGSMLVVSTLPECEMLAEMLGEATCFWSCDMCVLERKEELISEEGSALTYGIPLLVRACERIHNPTLGVALSDPHYQEAYCVVAEGALRSGLMHEELRLRCAMLLLGQGSVEELEEVCNVVDGTIWRTLPRDAPFFGVDVVGRSFACICGNVNDSLCVLYPELSKLLAEWPDLVARATCVLASRGDLSRAALVISLCSDKVEKHHIVTTFASAFINVGEIEIVDEVMQWAEEACLSSGVLDEEAQDLLCAFRGEPSTRAVPPLRRDASCPQELHALLACWCRDLMQGMCLEPEGAEMADDALSQALVLHGQTIRLVAMGRLEDAYLGVLDAPYRFEKGTIAGSLLVIDHAFCALMSGVGMSQSELESFGRAHAFLERTGLAMLCGLHEATIPLASMLVGRCVDEEPLERQMQRAARCGCTLMVGVLQLGCAVGDIRAGALARAHVRLDRAREAFGHAGAEYLEKVACVLGIGLHAMLGSSPTRKERRECRGGGDALDFVAETLLAACTTGKAERVRGFGRWSAEGCPKELLWLVNVLSRDCGDLSVRFRRCLPNSWYDAVDQALREVEPIFWERGKAADSGSLVAPAPVAQSVSDMFAKAATKEVAESLVEIVLLGGFEVRVGGRPLLGKRLEQRRAKSLLALLAALPGHVAKRFTLMESIWPEYDYQSAKKCLYSATSALRTVLKPQADLSEQVRVVVTNKTEGTVSLDASYVSCDVDDFEGRARLALDSEGDDRYIVSLCREIEELYKGDLFVPSTDGIGLVERRSRELRELYADAMIAGSDAATHLGMKMLACRFARRAHSADDMREDAVRALVVSFCAAGRQLEAQRCYEGYASKVINMTRRPPSRGLRSLVDDLVHNPDRSELGERARLRLTGRKTAVEIVGANAVEPAYQLSLDLDGV